MSQDGPGRPKGAETKVISFRVPKKHADDIFNSVKKFIDKWYPQDKHPRK